MALLDFASVERCLGPGTKAVLLVHLYGQVREMERWMTFCKDAKIHLLEDCAQTHGAVWNGHHAGAFGTWGAFSFYPTNNLGAKAMPARSSQIPKRSRRGLRRCDSRGLSAAASHADQCLSLPCHPQLHDDDVAKITATINQFE